MHEMAAVHPRLVTQEYGMETKGDRSLEPRIENGVKVFNLEVSVIRWHILPKVAVDAFAYNGQIPGLRIRVTQGDHVRNHRPHSIAGIDYGLLARAGFAEQDGWPSFHHAGPRLAAGTPTLTNSPQTKAGTFFYHSHDHPDRQQGLGLYGAFIIDPRERGRDESKADLAYVIQLQEWFVRDRLTHPGDAHGRWASELLHDQQACLSFHRRSSHESGADR
jgi:manganese oxidase